MERSGSLYISASLLQIIKIMSKDKRVELSQETGYDRNKFLILCYQNINMTPEDPGDIAKQGLVRGII